MGASLARVVWWGAVVGAAVACGSEPVPGSQDGGSSGDGAWLDAPGIEGTDGGSVDAALPDVPAAYECDVHQPGTVRVHTNSPNVTLLIHDVFGSLVSRTTSGSSGTADITVPGCGAVTAIRPGLYHTVTYVRGGDDLWIESPPNPPQPLQGPARLYIDNDVAGATSYFILGPVSSSLVANSPTARDLYWSNLSLTPQGLATIAVHPTDLQTSRPDIHNYSVLENVSLSAAVQSPLHVTTWSSQTSVYQVRILLQEPAKVIDARLANWTNDLYYWPQYAQGPDPQTTHEFDFELSAYGEGLSVGGRFLSAIGQVRGYHAIIAKPSTPTIELDLTQELLPEFTGLGIAPSPSRPTFSWTFSSTPSSVEADLTMFRTYGPVQWRVALPPGVTSFRLLELPPDLAHDFSAVNSYGVALHEASDYPGYATARARFVETVLGGRRHPMGLILRTSSIGSAL